MYTGINSWLLHEINLHLGTGSFCPVRTTAFGNLTHCCQLRLLWYKSEMLMLVDKETLKMAGYEFWCSLTQCVTCWFATENFNSLYSVYAPDWQRKQWVCHGECELYCLGLPPLWAVKDCSKSGCPTLNTDFVTLSALPEGAGKLHSNWLACISLELSKWSF